jgi:hypothetical protein
LIQLDTATAETFRPYLDTRFEISQPGLTQTLTLAEVIELPHNNSPRRAPFSILFTGDAAMILPQQIYTLHHDALGELTIFLVPLQPDRRGALYEAVFN